MFRIKKTESWRLELQNLEVGASTHSYIVYARNHEYKVWSVWTKISKLMPRIKKYQS